MDDTELAEVTTPALTSVGLGAFQRGRAAAQLLLDRLEHPDRDPRLVTVAPHLSVRDSSRRPTDGATGTPGSETSETSATSHPSSEER
jgi:DNA-binding LacI/PurR family transcriptional regulator